MTSTLNVFVGPDSPYSAGVSDFLISGQRSHFVSGDYYRTVFRLI